jgi:hypothetical protein
MIQDTRPFDPNLADLLSKIVHDNCKKVPHDIGMVLAKEVKKYEEQKKQNDSIFEYMALWYHGCLSKENMHLVENLQDISNHELENGDFEKIFTYENCIYVFAMNKDGNLTSLKRTEERS